jgi:putative FmdB family regulatory protein
MPTYEYACTTCDEHVEVVQSFKDEPLTECPACGGPLRKVFAPIGVVFKGSGFYKTDSRTSTKSSKAASGDSSSSGEASGSGTDTGSGGSGKDAASGTSGDKKPAKDTKPASSGTSSSGTAAAS